LVLGDKKWKRGVNKGKNRKKQKGRERKNKFVSIRVKTCRRGGGGMNGTWGGECFLY
jgi:hypothetical protein